jgi:hypothetical protein
VSVPTDRGVLEQLLGQVALTRAALRDARSEETPAAWKAHNKAKRALRQFVDRHPDVLAVLLADANNLPYEMAARVRAQDERDEWKRRAEDYAPGRVEAVDSRTLEMRYRIDSSTLAYARSPEHVIDAAVESCRHALWKALP